MPHPFLSAEWIAEARAIGERHAADSQPMPQALKLNLVVEDAPFGNGAVHSYLDTSSGEAVLELGQLDDADVTVSTDYETAKIMFVTQDPAAAMQAFMAGKVVVQGDMMKLLGLQGALTANPAAEQIAEEIRNITA